MQGAVATNRLLKLLERVEEVSRVDLAVRHEVQRFSIRTGRTYDAIRQVVASRSQDVKVVDLGLIKVAKTEVDRWCVVREHTVAVRRRHIGGTGNWVDDVSQ